MQNVINKPVIFSEKLVICKHVNLTARWEMKEVLRKSKFHFIPIAKDSRD